MGSCMLFSVPLYIRGLDATAPEPDKPFKRYIETLTETSHDAF